MLTIAGLGEAGCICQPGKTKSDESIFARVIDSIIIIVIMIIRVIMVIIPIIIIIAVTSIVVVMMIVIIIARKVPAAVSKQTAGRTSAVSLSGRVSRT